MKYDRRTAKIASQYPLIAGGRRGAPISMQVALTDSCFNRCIMCDHPSRPQKRIEVRDWLAFMYELQNEGLAPESVCYSGGDPMAYRDFNDVMSWHVTNKVAFGATITGFIPPFIDVDLLARAQWVRVSLDAVTPDIYKVVRGHTPVEKVLDGIDVMMEAGTNVCLGITVHAQNERDLPNVLAYAAAKGITDIDTRHVYPDSAAYAPDWSRDIMPFNNCHAALYQLYIDSDGSVYPCCITAGDTRGAPTAAALGNMLTEPWRQVWDRVIDYTKIAVADLPDICRTCCVQRLSEINYVCGEIQREWPQGSKNFY